MILYFIDYASFKVTTKQWQYFPVLFNIYVCCLPILHIKFCIN